VVVLPFMMIYLRLLPSLVQYCDLERMKSWSSHPLFLGCAFQVLPYAVDIVRALVSMLDDKKRLVRKEAVKCRSQW
jgi:hypothetical protein